MLYTFIENYQMKFRKMPQEKSIRFIAYIISWNVWQMDGLKRVVPDSCHDELVSELFGEVTGILAAHSIPNMFYIFRKNFSQDERRFFLKNLCNIFKISDLLLTSLYFTRPSKYREIL